MRRVYVCVWEERRKKRRGEMSSYCLLGDEKAKTKKSGEDRRVLGYREMLYMGGSN